MGDLIVQTAVFASLRKTFPGAEIIVLCEERISVALSTNNDIDAVWGVPFASVKKQRGLRGLLLKARMFFSCAGRIRAHKFTRVLITDYNDRACIWAYFSGAGIRGGLKHQGLSFLLNRRLDEREGSGDYIDFYLKIAGTIGAVSADRHTSFPIPVGAPAVKSLIPGMGKSSFVIHPGASTAQKRWSAENWAEVARKILGINAAHRIVLVSGPGEKYLCDEIHALMTAQNRKRVFIFAERPLVETAVVMRGARLVFCLDSAARHLAAALGTPTISLVTQWILPNWGLYSEQESHYVVAADVPRDSYDISSIEIKDVMAAFRKAMRGLSAARR